MTHTCRRQALRETRTVHFECAISRAPNHPLPLIQVQAPSNIERARSKLTRRRTLSSCSYSLPITSTSNFTWNPLKTPRDRLSSREVSPEYHQKKRPILSDRPPVRQIISGSYLPKLNLYCADSI